MDLPLPLWPADNLGPRSATGLCEWLGNGHWSVGQPAKTPHASEGITEGRETPHPGRDPHQPRDVGDSEYPLIRHSDLVVDGEVMFLGRNKT